MSWLEFDSLVNARDLGGTPTTDGGAIAARRLIRSDNLQDLTPRDIERLRELNITDVIDLRSAFEVKSEGPSPLVGKPGFTMHHYSFLKENHGDEGHPDGGEELPGKALPWASAEHKRKWDGFAAHYLSYLSERPESVLATLRTIAAAEGAALVHCAAGKDRTGTTVAFALLLAGADREAVIADYVATSERIEKIIARLLASDTYHDHLKDRPISTHVTEAATMEKLLSHIDEHYGGVEGLLHTIGWTDEDTVQMRRHLREAA